ncbi:hypothetical protein [Pararhizobium mangrovi]|uniref:Uncharacterized protein n=1 Tax=Pararhizobium mangrovi TaxID=2590452 RepID=A0A506U1H8_9HYPH|nr:hypothetical protein [Pararhizobium mangrovi]TPW26854.1 hypothetical protein FJU11_13695 [Pararhizobium mangrovi]
MITYYVVQAFRAGKRGALIADAPVRVASAENAKRVAERLSQSKQGVVAFSRQAEPSTGDYEDAVVLAEYGDLPAEGSAA